jgi:hypothetical protein
MLSRMFLAFDNPDLQKSYTNERRVYYAKFLPIITATMLTISLILDAAEMRYETGPTTGLTTNINWIFTIMFFILTIIIRYCSAFPCWFVCPALTALGFYYFAVIDFDPEQTTVYYIMVIGINLSYFTLIIFNEVWLISSSLYTPMLAFFLWKTGRNLEGEENTELAVRVFFCALLYSVTAYRVEYLNKMAFIGKENSEKTFYRWLKIFETFPEGMALVRKNHLLYANKSLPEMLELGDFTKKSSEDYMEL